jgi:AcrR family transcriptional regulator
MVRPKVHDEALRRRLLERAKAALSTGGPAALSLRTLARDCETSTTAVYSLFGGKTGLLTALFDDAFAALGRRLQAVTPGEDSLDDIVRLGQAYRCTALDDPHLFAMMFTAETLLPAAAEARTAIGTALGPLREFVERAVARNALHPDTDPAAASLTLWVAVHGWVSLQLRGFLPPGADHRTFETALRAVLDAWRPHPAAAAAPDVIRLAAYSPRSG